MVFNSGLNYGLNNIKGKVAVISEESNLPSALFAIKNIKNSEIDLYIGANDKTILLNDIKDIKDSFINCQIPVFDYSVSEIFSPFEYNAVICIGSGNTMDKIAASCKAYATPVISQDINAFNVKIA